MTDSSMVDIQFPVNSDTIGVPTTVKVCSWDTGRSFPEFLAEMCTKMQLDQDTAVLGYKLSADRVKDSVRQLSTVEEYKFAMAEIRKKVGGARSVKHKLVLHNLVSTLSISLV